LSIIIYINDINLHIFDINLHIIFSNMLDVKNVLLN